MILLDAASLAQPNDEAQIHKSVFEKRELMNNYIELSMSMPVIGKGKGKGKGKGIDYSLSSKSSKASWSKSSKSKGKGSSKKSDKSGKGGGKEISLVPTVPTPTTAPIVAPPTITTTSPFGSTMSESPNSTPAPTLTPVSISPFTILYTIEQFRLPLASEYVSVANLTANYLNEYFRANFQETSLVDFVIADTMMTDNNFQFGQPVEIDYRTQLTFASASFIPSTEEFDELLASAFRDDNLAIYISLLNSLPISNIFQTTSLVTFEGSTSATVPATSADSAARAAGIAVAAGAGALIFIIAGVVMYRRKEREEVGKCLDEDGQMTVAGDTCGGSSMDSQSVVNQTHAMNDADGSSVSELGDFQVAPSNHPILEEGAEEETDDECDFEERGQLSEVQL